MVPIFRMSHSTQSIATPVPSATVILARQKDNHLQVYLLKRNSKSGFMAGKYVFPGGIVDPGDTDIDTWKNHLDLDAAQVGFRLGKTLPYEEILPYCVAAIRETFEESGVLFTKQFMQNTPIPEPLRLLRTSGEISPNWLAQHVAAGDDALAVSRLFCWAHWITPRRMKRRYDTRFFVAEMPAGQTCSPDKRETIHGIWVSPENGLAANLDQTIPLSPPTLVNLHKLLKFKTVDALKAEAARRPWGAPIMPRLIPLSGEAVILEPWDPMYSQEKVEIDTKSLPGKVLKAGEPFSRIWVHKDQCRPVSVTTLST